ncbi:hypothetical protein QFW77_15245 [Luteimonas sp. RD2P54]|uniref:Uncharacterized protein n=1 Tax=Luteimonas endophytica TaxID=3042023 RepID=A0ABT6JCN7_9GAMM|nr:hypothetical protein [Luteimonas endophytica]MDH5824330.1 hypothetical protein [Luteimonas endophytica]
MTRTREECEKTLRVYLFAARGIKLDEIDATIQAARDGARVAPELVQRANDARERCLSLLLDAYGKGSESVEFARVMDAGQTLFEIADRLHGLLQLQPLHDARCKVRAGGRKGAERRKQESAGKELRPRIVDAIRRYDGEAHKMASTLAKKFGCTPAYVRQIRNETALR